MEKYYIILVRLKKNKFSLLWSNTMASKTQQRQSIHERRIRHGDYLLTTLPAERELCEDTGASRMTARKAIERLMAKVFFFCGSSHRLYLHSFPTRRSSD